MVSSPGSEKDERKSVSSGLRTPTESLAKDLKNWMTNLPEKLKYVPFIYLAIPGSHDSMTYSISGKSSFAPDADNWLLNIKWLGEPLRSYVSRWSITQSADTLAQLEHGIRYLDLRVATKPGSDYFYFCHALYGHAVNTTLNDVNQFLDEHPGEIVILDFQHFYAFNSNNHQTLLQLIQDTFHEKIIKYTADPNKMTLNYLTLKHQLQVVIIYRSSEARGYNFWYHFPTPWPECTSITRLFSILDHGLAHRSQNFGYVSQCVLTPDAEFIITRPFSTLRTACANELQKPMLSWLAEQSPGNGKLNVTIADFAELNNWLYCKKVIDLNLNFM